MRVSIGLAAILAAWAGSASADQCSLSIRGASVIDGPCVVTAAGRRGLRVEADGGLWQVETRVTARGEALALWNAGPGGKPGLTPLGTLALADGCWTGDTASLCIRP